MKLHNWIIDKIITRAQRTSYMHLDAYMNRWWLFRIWREGEQAKFAARIHQILRSDEGRDFHDHPWPYLTIILRGGYTEHRPVFDKSGLYKGETSKWYGPGSIIFRPARSWHRLELPEGQTAWTLFITGPKCNQWGFLVEPRHKVYYRQYHRIFPVYLNHDGMPTREPVFSGQEQA